MRLLRAHIVEATTCGGLLDGLDFQFRTPSLIENVFDPLCLIGSNGSGKSQFLQLIAEIFLSAWHQYSPDEEAADANSSVLFEIEYLIWLAEGSPTQVRLSRLRQGQRKPSITMQVLEDGEWRILSGAETNYLPSLIVGYTSGGNETLSLPFAISRMEYAERVGRQAKDSGEVTSTPIPNTRSLLIDYTTHLEVLVANLLLGSSTLERTLLSEPQLKELRSFRCTVQLAHSAAPTGGIQLTEELEGHLENLKRCATCWQFKEDAKSYIFDFYVSDEIQSAFRHYWQDSLTLYRSLHKLAMLNDLALPRYVQQAFKRDVAKRRFATRMPEPADLDKVFRFERVTFRKGTSLQPVDYVSLSDGEHQLVQVLGTLAMVGDANALFLLDEPESHFNPQWRVKFVQKILDVPTIAGPRKNWSDASRQELFLTTHAPFVPSDMSRDNILVFSKNFKGNIEIRRPDIETFGTTFDRILEHCFLVTPPISKVALAEINTLLASDDQSEIEQGLGRLGASVEKTYVAQHLRKLKNTG